MYDNSMNGPWDISRQIAARRKELGLSLTQLARRADTSPATLSRYENGWSRFELTTLRKLATPLDCDLAVKLKPRHRRKDLQPNSEVVEQLRRLFWDVRLAEHHLDENTLWVVERVLEYGTLDDLHTLIGSLGRAAFLGCVAEARFSSDRSRVFWQRMLAKEGMTCTRRYSRVEAASSWRGSVR